MDFNKIPKQFCENVVAGHSEENFVMIMSVGETANAYALTPPNMKRLVQSLTHQVEEYEKSLALFRQSGRQALRALFNLKILRGVVNIRYIRLLY